MSRSRGATARRAGGVQGRAQEAAKGALTSWAAFTWARDTARAFRAVPHVALNWLVAFGLGVAWWQMWATAWKPLAALTGAGLLYTVGRAARWVPGTQKTVLGLYTATAKACGHPTITRAQPVDPKTRVKVTGWKGPSKVTSGMIAYDSASPAAVPATRWAVEKTVETACAAPGADVVFDYESSPGWVTFRQVPDSDVEVARKKTRRWVESTIAQIIPIPKSSGNTLDIDMEWSDGDRPDVPVRVVVGFGAHDVGGRTERDVVEARFDQAVTRGVEWLHDWSVAGVWQIEAVPADSDAAAKKRTARKVSSVVLGAVQRAGGAKAVAQTTVDVTRWAPDVAPVSVRNTPVEVTVGLGVADFSNLTSQHLVENVLDQALEAEWRDRVWLYRWQMGHATTLVAAAVPSGHAQALRKKETLRLRSVAQQKIKTKRGEAPVDVDITDWAEVDGRQRAARMRVSFGTADVTNPDTRRAFMDHFDSLTDANDWRYEWDPGRGEVEITAVPVLPGFVPFPAEGSEECQRWHALFRDGKVLMGPAKGGYEAVMDFGKSPHALVGGSTGAGKSVLLTLVLYGALMNPDAVELVVVDPKVTDFTWTPGYPNVRKYAVTDVRRSIEEIAGVTAYAEKSMNARQALLRQHGVENLGELRRGIREGKITGITLDEVPRRLIVFFDEGGAAFTPVKDSELKLIQDESRTSMEKIGMLGRAMEVNIVMAAQKPSAENIGTALRAQLVNRVSVGPLNTNESIQVLGNTLATSGLDGAPKGRGWFVNDAGQELLFQTYFLPKRDTPNFENPSETIHGAQERVADRLAGMGWTAVTSTENFTRPDEDGNTVTAQVSVTKWVRLDRVDADDAADEDVDEPQVVGS